MHTQVQTAPAYHGKGIVSHTVVQSAPTIRAGAPGDALVLSDLLSRMIVEAHRSAVDPVELQRFAAEAFSVARMQADLSDPTMLFLLAQMGDKVCGMVRLHPSTPPTCVQVARPVELARLYLEADAIGRGVGSKLMATALARAAADGYETCWLCVWTGNQRAINFYQRWGFETLDLVFLPVIDSQVPCLVMARSLAMTAPLVQ